MRFSVVLFACLGFASSEVRAIEVSGMEVPEKIQVDSHALLLNGAGIRKAGFLFVKVKIYVVALFVEKRTSESAEVFSNPGIKRVELIFLRDLIERDVKEAWTFLFKESVSVTYPEIQRDLDQLLTLMDAIKEGDKHSFEMDGDTTRFYVNQNLKGEIKGSAFQKAFLSIWIGKTPAQMNLKEALLGKKD